jgi:nicotinate-nucleotide adenylyltransferase
MQPVGVLGGSFDPVHVGHLRAALDACEALSLAEVRLVPSATPPHRPPPRAPAAERCALLAAAIAGEPRLVVDDRELRRAGPSYTFDTLAELRAELGARRPLVLLLGADAFAGLATWHRWRELFGLAHLAHLARPGAAAPVGELAAEVAARRVADPAALAAAPGGAVIALAGTALEVSSSDLRARLARGASVRYLVPDGIVPMLRGGSYQPREEA